MKTPKIPESVTPRKIIEFALAHGWFEFHVRSKGIRVFQQWQGDDFAQITVPLDPTLSDYDRATFLACKTLAERAGLRFPKEEYDFTFLDRV